VTRNKMEENANYFVKAGKKREVKYSFGALLA
jgi:hypothetical protein